MLQACDIGYAPERNFVANKVRCRSLVSDREFGWPIKDGGVERALSKVRMPSLNAQ